MTAKQTILVTGGAGFIGSNFVHTFLLSRQGTVINLDKLTYAGNLQNLEPLANNPRHIFVKGDIGDRKLVAKLLEDHRPQAIINFAAEAMSIDPLRHLMILYRPTWLAPLICYNSPAPIGIP